MVQNKKERYKTTTQHKLMMMIDYVVKREDLIIQGSRERETEMKREV